MMTTLPEFFDSIRLQKRQSILERGENPYPYDYNRTNRIEEIIQRADSFISSKESCSLVGRIVAQRVHGKSLFIDMEDETEKIQVYFKQSELTEITWLTILKLVDLSDWIEVTGFVFKTRMGELTIHARDFRVLAKAVVSVPIAKATENKSYYKVSDPEIKYREKYTDWITDPISRKRIYLRAKIISLIRRWMDKYGFLEVQTPTIEMIYGGAEARPFETSIWALNGQRAYLRISPELYLKRYIVGGFPKVYTICQNFRNEGIDRSHNPEFTMIEWYEAGTDYEIQMQRFESLVAFIVCEMFGNLQVVYQGRPLDFTTPWKRLTMVDGVKQEIGFDPFTASNEEIRLVCEKYNIEYSSKTLRGILIAQLFELLCEPKLLQPTFVLDHPVEISPLTKMKRGSPGLVERFEPFIMGMEVGNAYSELTDPVEQLDRFRQQKDLQKTEGYETHPIDMDFIKAIGSGMPPTGGVGLGIDRLIMLLTDAPSIRDVVPFPMMKPVHG